VGPTIDSEELKISIEFNKLAVPKDILNNLGNIHLMTSIPLKHIILSAGPFPAANPSHHADTGKPYTLLLAPVFRTALF
jgi:hypothetical protein